MTKRTAKNLTVAALLAACSTALGVENAGPIPAATQTLLNMYPGSAVHKDQDRVRILYGVPMTPGFDARNAADSFIRVHGEAFGCGKLSVQPDWQADFADGSKTVFVYQQFLAGLPVEYGCLKILVLNGAVPRVVYAAGTLAPSPGDAGFPAQKLDGPAALALVQAMTPWRKIPVWSAPEKVVFQGNGDWTAPVVAWKFTGESPNPDDKLRKTFFVDAATGRVLHVRDEVLYSDVNGSIQGMGSPGTYPDASYNPPALINIPEMRASIAGGNSALTDNNGLFTIPNSGTSAVSVSCGVNGAGAGQWANVVPTGVNPITYTLPGVVPPGPAPLVLNSTPSEQLTAQVNAFVCATLTHNYIKDHAPSITRWDSQLTVNTGVSGSCNAFYSANTINFYNSGGGCVNSAYSTVVSHEFGHWIVSRLGVGGAGLAQNAFGEGYGDTNAEMIWNDQVIARGFYGTQSSNIRDPLVSNIQYPCTQEIHTCGMVLSGAWWRTRLNMGTAYGDPTGLNLTRQLEVSWSLATTGGPNSSDAAGPGTAIEVLVADDDDGNINNGTPNYFRICPAFAAQNIQCPALTLIAFQYPSGRPAQIVSGQPTNIPVNVVGVAGNPNPGTGVLVYRINGGSFSTIPMTQGTPNQYTATLPPVPCGQTVDYYVGAQAIGGSTVFYDPLNAPTTFYSAQALANATPTTIADLNFETDPGWTVINYPPLVTGAWERTVPAPTGTAGPAADYNGGGGQCWVTDNRVGSGIGAFDVSGGPTILTTGSYDLTGYALVTVSYARWFYCVGGTADHLVAQVSGDAGVTWTTLESASHSPAWSVQTFNVPISALTSQAQFRWVVSDSPHNSVTEAALDAFKLTGFNCIAPCYANCDGSTVVPILNVNDFSCFLNKFAAGDTYANCDQSTVPPVLNVLDFTCFLNAFAAGCS